MSTGNNGNGSKGLISLDPLDSTPEEEVVEIEPICVIRLYLYAHLGPLSLEDIVHNRLNGRDIGFDMYPETDVDNGGMDFEEQVWMLFPRGSSVFDMSVAGPLLVDLMNELADLSPQVEFLPAVPAGQRSVIMAKTVVGDGAFHPEWGESHDSHSDDTSEDGHGNDSIDGKSASGTTSDDADSLSVLKDNGRTSRTEDAVNGGKHRKTKDITVQLGEE